MVFSSRKNKIKLIGKTAFICGGSKGIGKETAREFMRQGGNVCILARDLKVLQETKSDLEELRISNDQFIKTISGDATDMEEVRPKIESFIKEYGTPDFLINAVGYAYPEYVENLKLKDFKKNMDVNYYGQLVPTLLFLPYMIANNQGHISFISSIMGYMGIIGYASYAPTKFALVGLAEVLRHELSPYNISISILYPPDTDTPGFEVENQTKPVETAILSETAKLYTPEKVARKYLSGILKGKFHIMLGEGVWIWRLFRYFPKLVHAVTDYDLRKARKKLGKE